MTTKLRTAINKARYNKKWSGSGGSGKNLVKKFGGTRFNSSGPYSVDKTGYSYQLKERNIWVSK